MDLRFVLHAGQLTRLKSRGGLLTPSWSAEEMIHIADTALQRAIAACDGASPSSAAFFPKLVHDVLLVASSKRQIFSNLDRHSINFFLLHF